MLPASKFSAGRGAPCLLGCSSSPFSLGSQQPAVPGEPQSASSHWMTECTRTAPGVVPNRRLGVGAHRWGRGGRRWGGAPRRGHGRPREGRAPLWGHSSHHRQGVPRCGRSLSCRGPTRKISRYIPGFESPKSRVHGGENPSQTAVKRPQYTGFPGIYMDAGCSTGLQGSHHNPGSLGF